MEITDQQKKELAKIAKEYGLTHIVLFGSQAKQTAREGSDIDIAIISDKKLNRADYAKIISSFSRIFGASSDKMDLTEVFRADPLLLYHTMFDGRLLYGDNRIFQLKKMYALKRFMDHKKKFSCKINTLSKNFMASLDKNLIK